MERTELKTAGVREQSYQVETAGPDLITRTLAVEVKCMSWQAQQRETDF